MRYERELRGSLLTLFHHQSEVLRGNFLGDSAERDHPILIPPGGGSGLPLVVVLVGFTGCGERVLSRTSFWGENLPQRLARLSADGALPPAVYLWPSCETHLGGSQYLNSVGTGRYEDFLRDELIPAVEATRGCGGPERRIVVGKSSGGYGSLVLAMRNPGFFAAAGSHAGDMAFDLTHLRGFPEALNCWRHYGGPAAFLDRLPELRFGSLEHAGIEHLAMASCYSPNPESPLGVDLPVDPETGAPRPEVFQRWLVHDPLRMLEDPAPAEGLRRLRALYLDAGERDEFSLQWGLRRFAKRLGELGIKHRAKFFDGGHFDIDVRYESSLPYLLAALD